MLMYCHIYMYMCITVYFYLSVLCRRCCDNNMFSCFLFAWHVVVVVRDSGHSFTQVQKPCDANANRCRVDATSMLPNQSESTACHRRRENNCADDDGRCGICGHFNVYRSTVATPLPPSHQSSILRIRF